MVSVFFWGVKVLGIKYARVKMHGMVTNENKWSVSKELQRVTKTDSLAKSVIKLGLAEKMDDQIIILDETSNWTRGGAETYIFDFNIIVNGIPSRIMLKACISGPPARKIDDVIGEWVMKRLFLRDEGINTPKLYACAEGMIVEEYIDRSLKESLLDEPLNINIIKSIAKYIYVLQKSGFNYIDPFKDLRIDNDSIICIDFGEDIGQPHQIIYPETDGGNLDGKTEALLLQHYSKALVEKIKTFYMEIKNGSA